MSQIQESKRERKERERKERELTGQESASVGTVADPQATVAVPQATVAVALIDLTSAVPQGFVAEMPGNTGKPATGKPASAPATLASLFLPMLGMTYAERQNAMARIFQFPSVLGNLRLAGHGGYQATVDGILCVLWIVRNTGKPTGARSYDTAVGFLQDQKTGKWTTNDVAGWLTAWPVGSGEASKKGPWSKARVAEYDLRGDNGEKINPSDLSTIHYWQLPKVIRDKFDANTSLVSYPANWPTGK